MGSVMAEQQQPAKGQQPPARSENPPEPGGNLSIWSIPDKNDPRLLPPWFRRAVVMVLILVIASQAAVWAFGQLTNFWFTIFFAFFLGLAMEPVVNRLERRGIRRGLGTFIVLGGLIGGTVVFFWVFGALLAEQLAGLVQSVPDLIENAIVWINDTFDTDFNVNEILDAVGLSVSDLAGYAADLGLGLLNVIFSAVGAVFSLFTVLLFAFYFAADGPRLRRTMASWLRPDRQRTFVQVWDISTQKAGGYVISRGIMAVISAIFHGIVFYLIDLPYWLPMALWVGLVSQFIPTIGTYLAGALPIILALAEGDPLKAVIVLAAVTAYQQVENYYVQPRVTQSTLEIHAAVAFGSVIVGATLFGATGALLAIPVVATLQAVADTYGKRYQLVDELRDPDEIAGLPMQDQTLLDASAEARPDA
jgi:predicted PurR-regulated permease PerM